jgi:DNA-binding NtrC family response regulator
VILLVEDEPIIRSMLAEEFRIAGFGVLEAEHAAAALAFIESPLPIDLVCTDVRMPGEIDGLTLAKTVRAKRPGARIMIVSGHMPDPPPAEIQDAFFTKPYNIFSVVERAVELLSGDET